MDISYCPLYDQVSERLTAFSHPTLTFGLQGYTSLGGTEDTLPNPHLKKEGSDGKTFRPAYELVEDDEERLGRE